MNDKMPPEASNPTRPLFLSDRTLSYTVAALTLLGAAISYFLYQTDSPLAPFPMLGAAFIAFLIIGATEYTSPDTPDGFFLYERRMPIGYFAWTYVAANVGLFSSIYYSLYLAHYFGPAGMLWPTLAWVVGMYWFYRCTPRVRDFFSKGQSIHEFIGTTFGRTDRERLMLRRITSSVTMTLLWASIAIEVKFGSMLIAGLAGSTSAFPIAAVIAALAATYSYLSGYRGATKTDLPQGIAIVLGAITLVLFSAYHLWTTPATLPAEYHSLSGVLIGPSWASIVGMVALLLPYQFCVMDMWQRCFAVSQEITNGKKDDRGQAREKWYLFTYPALIFCALFACWFFVATVAKATGLSETPDGVLNSLISHLAASKGAFTIVLLVSLLAFAAAMMSTFDTFLVALTQAFMYDWYGQMRPKLRTVILGAGTLEDQHRFVNTSRFWLGIIGVSAVVLAAFDFSLISFWVGMYSLMLSFFPVVYLGVMYGEFCRAHITASTAMASILTGFLTSLLCGVLGTFFGFQINGVSLADVNSLATLAVSSIVLSFGVVARLARTVKKDVN
jgi:Na+/proline symporter